MHDVYRYGTASAIRIPDIEIGGKTGTVENYTRIDGKRVQLTDHSIFVAFAPIDDLKLPLPFRGTRLLGFRWAEELQD